MSIKNFIKIIILGLFIAFAMPHQSMAATNLTSNNDSTANAAMLSVIVNRVNEIQQMEKTNLSGAEKKALKNELKIMKQKAEGLDKRVYLSVGAIIIILLLLILILR